MLFCPPLLVFSRVFSLLTSTIVDQARLGNKEQVVRMLEVDTMTGYGETDHLTLKARKIF